MEYYHIIFITKTEEYLINMKKTFILFLLFIVSCSSVEYKKSSNPEDAIQNVIKDFSNSKFRKNNKIYEILQLSSNEDLYLFTIKEMPFYSPKISDTIGSKTKSFPTSFRLYNKSIFLWSDKDSIISKNLLDMLKKNVKLDSSLYKFQKGILVSDNDFPVVVTNERKKGIFYFVCKNNVSIFYRLRSTYRPKIKDYPFLDCNKKNE